MNNYFSKNLRYLRLQKGMTQLELANKIDKDYTTIGKWESGQRSPIMNDLIKVAEFFNVDIDKLITENLALLSEKITLSDIKTNINSLSEKDMNKIGKDTLINMVDFYHEKTIEENKEVTYE